MTATVYQNVENVVELQQLGHNESIETDIKDHHRHRVLQDQSMEKAAIVGDRIQRNHLPVGFILYRVVVKRDAQIP